MLLQEADVMDDFEARTTLQRLALDLCHQAMQGARTIATATGNSRPLELAELSAARIKAAAPAELLAGKPAPFH